jgi:hypothetical protein
MLKQFYKKALATQGVYCATGIEPGEAGKAKVTNKFAENIDDLLVHVEAIKKKGWNAYVALGTFEGYSRKKDDCIYFRSLFIDLDVGEDKAASNKGYATKEAALTALDKFLVESELPPPIRIDSGTGIHAYWLLEEDVSIKEYLPYAVKFKEYVLERLFADPAVMAEPARIMRCPESLNYKTDPPSPAGFIDTEFHAYSFEAFKEFLGPVEATVNNVLSLIPKGLDEDTKKMRKLDNFVNSFPRILELTAEGKGCAQIQYAFEHAKHLEEPIWHSAMTVVAHCEDKEKMAHLLSKDYVGYSAENVDKKLESILSVEKSGPHTCATFEARNPGVCDGCPNRYLGNPIKLARILNIAKADDEPVNESEFNEHDEEEDEEKPIRKITNSKKVPDFPEYLAPFVRGVNGGIYFQPPAKFNKETEKYHDVDAILLCEHDFYPYRRIYSPNDGECFMMRVHLPNDGTREFLLPMKAVYSQDKFKDVLVSGGVFFNQMYAKQVQEYIMKWGRYFQNTASAETMRMQMGWADDNDTFVIGNIEVTEETGPEGRDTPVSPTASNVVKSLVKKGSFEKWKWAAQQLNDQPGLEMHAFGALTAYGAPLMQFASTDGVSLSYEGESGAAKSGALYAALSVWGNPKKMSIFESTDNAMQSRLLTTKNILIGVDEAGGKSPDVLSNFIHKIAQGETKMRLNGTNNAERSQDMTASTIGFYTTNHSLLGIVKKKKSTPYGETARMVELFVHKPQLFKDHPEKGKEIFDEFRKNYGHAGPVYACEMIKWGEVKMLKHMEIWITRFRKDFGFDVTYRYYEDLVACVMTGGEIAEAAGLIKYDLNRIYKVMVGMMIAKRNGGNSINESDFESVLGEFFLDQMGSTIAILNNKVISTPSPHRKLAVRVDLDVGESYVSTSSMNLWLAEHGYSDENFFFVLKNKGKFIKKDKKRLAAGWKGAPESANVQAYFFKEVPEINIDEIQQSVA